MSNVTGETITFYRSTEYWGIHSLAPFDDSHTEQIDVPVTRLDDFVREQNVGHVEFLKVDVEGADMLVLDGFDFTADRPQFVMAEFMDTRSEPHFGYTHHDIAQMMSDFGYACFVADWAPVVRHSRREGGGGPFTFLSCVPYPTVHEPAWGNLIFVPTEDRGRFGEVLHEYLMSLNSEIQATFNRNVGLVDGLLRKVDAQQQRIVELDSAIVTRDKRRAELDGAVSRRDSRIAELEVAIAQRDRRTAELDSAISGRDARIAELVSAIEGRDSRIASLDRAVAERDQRVAELDAMATELPLAERRLEQALHDWNATKAEAANLRVDLAAARRNAVILAVVTAVLLIATLALVFT